VKIPFLPLIIKAKSSILILPKYKPKISVFWPLDDIELVDWTTANFLFARLWFCEGIHHSSFLKLAIEKAIQKSTNANLSSKLFQDDSNNETNQFVGFVSSHKKGTLLTSFHIHSFVVFHTDLQKNTIVTCTLTAHNHIMSNMQDHLLQIGGTDQFFCQILKFLAGSLATSGRNTFGNLVWGNGTENTARRVLSRQL
jgi:hypothetical protein